MKFRKCTTWVLILSLMLSLIPAGVFANEGDNTAAVAESVAPFADFEAFAASISTPDSIVIINTNDVHGRNNTGYKTAGVAQLKKNIEAQGFETLLISAGDDIQGLPLVNYSQGAEAIEFLNDAKYDLMVPGNHEFDWGTDNLDTILASANFDVLSANIFNKSNSQTRFTAAETYVKNGVTVGVFGLTTPETSTKAHPDKVKDITISASEDMYDIAQAQVDILKTSGASLIICVGHLGVDAASAPNRSTDVIANVNGIDLFIDGHSHTNKKGDLVKQLNGTDETLLIQAETELKVVGLTVYNKTDKTLTSTLVTTETNEFATALGIPAYEVDTTIETQIDNRSKAIETDLRNQKIGETQVVLYGKNTSEPPGVRMSETNLGDLAADALLWQAKESLKGTLEVDLALTNGGGIRDSIPVKDGTASAAVPYTITQLDAVTVFPFGNTLAAIKITGAELLEALEAATFSSPKVVGAFPQVAGVTFEIHSYVEYVNGARYEGSTYYAPANPGSRIKNVKIGGQPLDLTKEYVVATNDFTAAGGDTYSVFKKASQFTNTGVGMDAALANYFAVALKGEPITADSVYAKPQGRIVYVTTKPVDPNPPKKSGGSSSSSGTTVTDIAKQLTDGATEVSVSVNTARGAVTVSAKDAKAIIEKGATLVVKAGANAISVEADTLKAAGGEQRSVIVTAKPQEVPANINDALLAKDAVNEQLLAASSISLGVASLKAFETPVTVTFDPDELEVAPEQLVAVFISETGVLTVIESKVVDGKIVYQADKPGNYAVIMPGSSRLSLSIDSAAYTVDGEEAVMDVAPEVINGYTMVPVRFIVESLGGNVAWDDATKTVTIEMDGKTVSVTIGQSVPGGSAPYLSNDRTMVPLSYIAQALGCLVSWNGETKAIDLFK